MGRYPGTGSVHWWHGEIQFPRQARSIGGTGKFNFQGKLVSHGSESYLPSPLTTEAYQKLCCVLHQEIANYQELLQRVQNLNDTAKEDCMAKVRESCGIDPSESLEDWRVKCQARIERDRPVWQNFEVK